MTPPPRVSVAIPTWNGKHHLELCLPSLRAQTYRDFEIVVIDNGSTDGTVAWLRKEYPEVKIVALPNNLGVTAAFNIAVRENRSEFLVLLNNDTEAEPTWLEELVRVADKYPAAGSVASKMKVWDDRTLIHTAGDFYTVSGRPGNRGVWQKDDGRFDAEEWVFGACGGAALYRKELFEAIGEFDYRLESYLEDVDLAWRAQLAGYGTIFAPNAVIYHKISATGGGVFASFFNGRNWIYVLVKNMPAGLLKKHWVAILREQFTVTWDALKAWRGAAARARLRGQIAGVLALPKLLAWRREVQDKRTVTDEAVERVLEK
jgi:GT2 family glycosyltransferase